MKKKQHDCFLSSASQGKAEHTEETEKKRHDKQQSSCLVAQSTRATGSLVCHLLPTVCSSKASNILIFSCLFFMLDSIEKTTKKTQKKNQLSCRHCPLLHDERGTHERIFVISGELCATLKVKRIDVLTCFDDQHEANYCLRCSFRFR